jgi:hypothetical protein
MPQVRCVPGVIPGTHKQLLPIFEELRMNSVLGRRLLAVVGTLIWLGSSATAEELNFTSMERRIGRSERSKTDATTSTTAFLADTPETSEGQLPMELGSSNSNSSSIEELPMSMGEACACGGNGCTKCCSSPPLTGVYTAEVQLYWMRAHVMENAIGKLSEKYELSPRFILAYDDAHGAGARVRYWLYGRWTPNLGDPDEDIRFEMNVLDFEATKRFRTERADLIVAGGMRWADMEIAFDDDDVQGDMPGLTAAADLRVSLCRDCRREWAVVGGTRWSLLGGDWEGSGGFIDPVRDDNIVVQELYTGVEYYCTYGDYDLFARLKYEMQNWHSDAIAQASGTDSIGFLGPAFEFGLMF